VVDTINAEAPAKKSFKFTISLNCSVQPYKLTQEQTLRFSFPPSAFTGFITITIDGSCNIPARPPASLEDDASAAGFDAGLPNPALIELGSPRIRLVVIRVSASGYYNRRIMKADAADGVSLTGADLSQCNAQGGDGGCIYLPTGTRLSLVFTSFIVGVAKRGSLIAMATGLAPQKGTYLSATGGISFYSNYLSFPQAGSAIYVFKQTPSKLNIKLLFGSCGANTRGCHSGVSDQSPAIPVPGNTPAACSFLVTERADNSTAAEEGGGISLQLKMDVSGG
jgi:hypothetical protein